MAKKSSALGELVNQMPDPDQRGMYCTDIDKGKIENAVAQIHKGGRKSILRIIDMLVAPGEGNDIKARYALHCLALHCCKLDDDKARKRFAMALASQLGGDRPKAVQEYIIQELQAVGGKEVVKTLGKMLSDEELCEPAAMALVAIGDGAAKQLRGALRGAKGKCLLTLVQNLGVVRDAGAVKALKGVLGAKDRELRIAAAWALANIGDAGSVDLLLKAADSEGWEKIQATKACLVLAEKLIEAGKKDQARKIYRHFKNSSEKYISDVAKSAPVG